MTLPARCTLNDVPFFRVIVSFCSMLTINRYCHPQKILSLLRSHFCLLKSTLPIVLHAVKNNEECILKNDMIISKSIESGFYLVFLKYDDMKYQPLIDLKLIPMEIFPQKIFLPKSIPFIIYETEQFVKALSSMIDYMKEYDKNNFFYRKYTNIKNESNNQSPLHSLSQLSTSKRTLPTKNVNIQKSSTILSPDLISTPISRLTIIPARTSHEVDIRKSEITDSEQINQLSLENNSMKFNFRLLNRKEQMIYQQAISGYIKRPLAINLHVNKFFEFNENELILFKQHLYSISQNLPLILDLKNCIHQLAIDNKLDQSSVYDLLIKLDYKIINNQLYSDDILKIIKDLQEAASNRKEETVTHSRSNLMKTLLRIDNLEKFNKLDKEKVNLFNQRIIHLARMGIVNQQLKMFKKLFQLDLFNNEPNQQMFSKFIVEDLQRIIPKLIPLNYLGVQEIIYQLRFNIDRLGPITTLILIDSIQRIVQSGSLLTLYKTLYLKRCLIQFVEHIQTGRLVGMHLQRLIEQMNITKKFFFTNQLNILLQKTKLMSNNKTTTTWEYSYDELISILMNLAYQGQLNTYHHVLTQQRNRKEQNLSIDDTFQQMKTYDNTLQSIINFLYEQSSVASPPGPIPYEYINEFIQYLRHYAQLGILYEPQILDVLTDLHKAKDRNYITLEMLKTMLEHIQTSHYLYAYNHLNLIEFENFLNDMISQGYLTRGQAWFVLDRLINLCQIEPITNYDIKLFLMNIQLEYNRQQPIYSKLIDCLQSLAASCSKSLAEFYSLERELQKLVAHNSNTNTKRIPDDIRKRLNDILFICKKLNNDHKLIEQSFSQTLNLTFYSRMKEILKTKSFLTRKQSLTAITLMQKHFLKISISNYVLSDHELDKILEHKYLQQDACIETNLKRMIELGQLQNDLFVRYLLEYFSLNESSSYSIENLNEIRLKLLSWPLTLDLNHSDVRQVIEHLIQLEQQNKIDTGTFIEIQNRLNQLARFGKTSLPQIKFIMDEIHRSYGKMNLFDRVGFQSVQFYRLILNDITNAIQLEFYIQQLTSDYKLSYRFNYRFRHFLYQILQNELSINELTVYRFELEKFHSIKKIDIDQIKNFIDLLPKEIYGVYPLTLTDKLLERFKWDGKIFDKSIRDNLLKFERVGILSQDNFEEIYNYLYHTTDISLLPLHFTSTNDNQLIIDLFDKINDLVNDGSIDLQTSIDIKEEMYFLENVIDRVDLSKIITVQSRLLNSSNHDEFDTISKELKTFVYQEQFRLSRMQDLISIWNLKKEKGNSHGKQIMKLVHELANLNRLYTETSLSLFNRYVTMKQINQIVYRNLIKDLQRLKDRALIEIQIIECIRLIEIQFYKTDYRKYFNEILIKKLENHLKEMFNVTSFSFEHHLRVDLCKKLTELIGVYIQSHTNENSFDELLTVLDVYMSNLKYSQSRSSKSRHHYASSDVTVSTISSSQSLQNIL